MSTVEDHPVEHPGMGSLGRNAVMLSSSVAVGFLVGWILRARGHGNFFGGALQPFRSLASIARHSAIYGKVPRTKMALVVRTDLKMTPGKICAQCGHAAVGAVQNFPPRHRDLMRLWRHTGSSKVVLKVAGEQDLLKITTGAKWSGVNCFVVRDAGKTEVEAGSITVVAVGPDEVERVDAITGSLKLL